MLYPQRIPQFFTLSLKKSLTYHWRIPLILTQGGYIMTSLATSLFLICFNHLNVFDTPSGPCVVQRLFLHNVRDRSPSDYNFKQTLWKRRSCCHWCIWWERLVIMVIILHLGLVFISFTVDITYVVDFYDIYGLIVLHLWWLLH